MANLKLPKEVYIRIEEDVDTNYLVADRDAKDFAQVNEPVHCGMYRLVNELTVSARTVITARKVKAAK